MTEAPPRPTWWRYWLIAPVVAQLRQGITPEHLALTIALATTLGVFPILGATTLLCVLVAARLRLNQPLMQLANYLIYPLCSWRCCCRSTAPARRCSGSRTCRSSRSPNSPAAFA